jgi:mannosyltransferase OCH1-like enzyme
LTSFFIIIINRLIKLIGALVKVISYLFHFVFPNKRFTIPLQSNPLIKSNKQSKIPKIIWQTNYTNNVSLPLYCNYLFNRLISPDWEYRYMGHEERENFMAKYAPQNVNIAFNKLTDGAAQADLWRVFILNYYGGVYMDFDAYAILPLSSMIDKDDTEMFLLNKQHFTNYFIASSKDNKVLQKTIDLIVDNITKKKIDGGVYNLTGPTVLNEAIGDTKVNHRYYRYTCNQGGFTNEYFQYIDKKNGKWTHAKKEDLLKD